VRRIPALDGWRGIAILLVLFDHLQSQWLGRYLYPWTLSGEHGVTLFFVLSGYLITSNLLRSPNLKAFYIRRFFRLMPVAWAYLLFIFVLSLAFPADRPSIANFTGCLLFFRNYVSQDSPFLSTGHFWSLSIEEQFYLIWPAILIFWGRKPAAWLAFAAAISCAAYRTIHWDQFDSLWPSFQTHIRADALCVGCLLALACDMPKLKVNMAKRLDLLMILALLTVVICVHRFHRLPPLYESVAIAILISGPVLRPDRFYSRALAFKPLAAIGLVSYSLYVWQQFFTRSYPRNATLFLDCLIPVVAVLSYQFLEKPFISMGRRLSDASSPRQPSCAPYDSEPVGPNQAFESFEPAGVGGAASNVDIDF